MQQQFSQSNKIVKEVTSELEKIKGTNEQVLNFATQMKSLEKILGNSKQRGILGEIQLENLLANVLPPDLFSMQHNFTNGETVDAIVKVGQFIIPIDAKFSLDNYNKMIESSDPNEIKTLETQFRKDIRSGLTRPPSIFALTSKPPIMHICLSQQMACIRICSTVG